MDTESLIEDALRLRAEQAPPEGNVLAALYRPKRSRKPLFLSLAAATGAVAIAAVAVVTTSNIRPSTEAGGQNTVVPTTTTTTAATSAPNVPATLGYSPTWLPEGMVERDRMLHWDERTQRGWTHSVPNGQSGTPMLSMAIEHSDAAKQTLHNRIANASGDSRVTINGKPAEITDPRQDTTNPDAEVVLNPEPGVYIQLTLLNAPDVRASALRIAESLRPDPTPVRAPVSIGGSADYEATAGGDGKWAVSATGEINGVGYSATLNNHLPPNLKNEPRTWVPTTARGVPAEYLGDMNGYLRLQLGPQLHLLIAGNGPNPASMEALVAAAEAIEVEPNPDMSWAGN
jgi:hypothetical protein